MNKPTHIEQAWDKIGKYHHHGILIHLLSIHTHNSCGNGEFLDLIPLIKWISSLGMDVLQLLPLNDSNLDPSPYNGISSLALNPIYLSLHALPNFSDGHLFDEFKHVKRIPYQKILEKKIYCLTKYVKIHGDSILKSEDYHTFLQTHHDLKEYALYKALKEKYGNCSWQQWPDDIKNLSHCKRHELEKTFKSQINFHIILQFLAHKQLLTVRLYADKHRVFLKGDVPFLINRESSDAWLFSELFDFSATVGSPPDSIHQKGQNWDLPLYNWVEMETNKFEWWKRKIQYLSLYFHLYRLDHILGFFRFWKIPLGKETEDGEFYPSDPTLMKEQGHQILNYIISASTMLPIGEDLGDPKSPHLLIAREIMQALNIPGTKIPRRLQASTKNNSCLPPNKYPPLSIVSVSNHDMEPLALWWKNFPKDAKAYADHQQWDYQPQLSSKYHQSFLREIHQCSSLFHVNLLQEYLALIPSLTWNNPEEERINIPGTVSTFNWTYRYKHNLETLIASKPLSEAIKGLLAP